MLIAAYQPMQGYDGPHRDYVFNAYWAVLQTGPGHVWVAGPDRVLHDERTVFLLDQAQTNYIMPIRTRPSNCSEVKRWPLMSNTRSLPSYLIAVEMPFSSFLTILDSA